MKKRKPVRCGFCKRRGHTRVKCPEIQSMVDQVITGAKQEFQWDVVKQLLLQVAKLQAKVEFLDRVELAEQQIEEASRRSPSTEVPIAPSDDPIIRTATGVQIITSASDLAETERFNRGAR